MIDRIKTLLSVKNLSSAQFAAEIGVQRSGISHILSGRNKPSLDFVLKILEHYPNINESWLLKGEGEMYKDHTSGNTLFEKPELQEEPVEKEEVKNKVVLETTTEEPNDIKQEEPNYSHQQISDSSLISKLQSSHNDAKIIKLIAVYEDNTFEIYNPK